MANGEGSILDQILATGGTEGAGFLQALNDPRFERLVMTSELPPPAVLHFATLCLIADRFGSRVLKGWAKRFLQAEVNKDRKGRLELVELFQAVRARAAEEE